MIAELFKDCRVITDNHECQIMILNFPMEIAIFNLT